MSSTSYRIISLARNGCQFLFRFHLVQCLPFEEEKNLLWPVQSLEQGDHESRIVQPFEIGSPFPIFSYLSSFASSCVQVIKLPVGYVSWAFELLVRRCWLRASWQPSWLWKKDFDISLKIMDPHNPPEKLHFTWFHWKPKVLGGLWCFRHTHWGGIWWNAPKIIYFDSDLWIIICVVVSNILNVHRGRFVFFKSGFLRSTKLFWVIPPT